MTAVLSALVVVLAAIHMAQVPLRIPLNYNEGWMAFFAARAVGGGVLYPAPGGLISNNYPPLSFYLVGTVGAAIGDNIVAGRALALAALCAVAGEIYWSARRLGAGVPAAVMAALVFALFNLTWFHAYVAMADPQWLGQAVMLAGLPLLLQTDTAPLSLWRAAGAALLMVAGGFIKHNLVALPLAAGLWLLIHDRRAFAAWTAAAACALLAGALWVGTVYGRPAFIDVLGDHRRFLPEQWPDAIAYVLPMVPLVAATVWLARRRGGEPGVRLALCFVAVSLPLALIQRLGEGVNVNGYFEALVALCIAAGVALGGAPLFWRGRAWPAAAVALALAAPTLGAAPYFLGKGVVDLARAPARAAAWNTVIASVAAAPGPAACEMLSVCYWAGKGFELDFFNYGQDLRAGDSAQVLTRALDAKRFGAIALTRDAAFERGDGRLPQPVPDRIEAAYAVRQTGPDQTVVMTPKGLPPGR